MIVTLTGENDYLVSSEIHNFIESYINDYGDLGLEKIDGDESNTEKIMEGLKSIPFLVSRKLVVLYNPSKQKKFTENFSEILGSIPDNTDVIIVEKKIDKRLSYYKELKRKTDFRELGNLDANSLATWIVQYSKSSEGQVSLADAHYLIDRVGINQLLLKNEVDKLLNYDKTISKKSIDLMTERLPQSTVFDLLEAAFSGNKSKTLSIYKEQRALKVEPQMIIGMLAWQIHLLALIKAFGSSGTSEISREAKINPYVVDKTKRIADRINMQKTKDMLSKLLELDISSKSTSIDIDESMQLYLLSLSN